MAWLAPFQGPVCAGNGMKALASSSQRVIVPPRIAARSDSLSKSPPTSAPTSSRPQGWNTYGIARPPDEMGLVWNNVRALENGRSDAPNPSHGWKTPRREVKKFFSLPFTIRTYAFSISKTSSGETESSDNEPKYFPHDPVIG